MMLCEKCRALKESGKTVYKGTTVKHWCDECLAEEEAAKA